MRKIIIVAAFLAAFQIMASAQCVENGSREVKEEKARNVMDFDIPFYHKLNNNNAHRHSGCDFTIGFGGIQLFTEKPYDFDMSKTFELPIYLLYKEHWGASALVYGVGFTWSNFTKTGNVMLSKADNGEIVHGPYPEGASPKFSRLSLFCFNLPVMYQLKLVKNFGFSIGPVLNFNSGGDRLKVKYRLDGHKVKDKYHNVHPNMLTVDIMAQLHVSDLSFYVKYSPMNLMNKDYWPGSQRISFGILL